MAAMSSIQTSITATSSLHSTLSGDLPSTTSCWDPSHSRHVWPTTPGSDFRINDCELYCFYCFKDGKYEGQYFSKAKRLRKHVIEAHLNKGQFQGVKLVQVLEVWRLSSILLTLFHSGPGIPNALLRKRKRIRRLSCLPSMTLAPQAQLSQLASILWLGEEHRVNFERLTTSVFSKTTSSLDNAVASFLTTYGPLLWPDDLIRRRHLCRPNIPSLKPYFGSILGPVYSTDAKMNRWKRRRFLRDHPGQEPDLVEKVAASPLGMAVYRYVELLKEAGYLNKLNNGVFGDCKQLLEKIIGAQVGDGADSFLEERESSPDIPLRRHLMKRKSQREHFDRDSSPEVPLATIQKRRKAAEAEVDRESSPDVLQMDMCSDHRRRLPAIEIQSAVHANTAVQRHYSSGSTNAAAASTPLDVGIACQPTSSLDLDLPLWNDFMNDADTNAGATDVELPDLSSVLRELQTSFTPFGNVATEAESLVQPELSVQPPAMPDDHFLNQDPNFRQDRLFRENSGQRSASQADSSLVGLPGLVLPSTASDLSCLVTQPVHSNRMHLHHQWHEPRRMDRQDRRDSVLQNANGSFLLTTPIHSTWSATQTFDPMVPRHQPTNHMLLPGLRTTRICMPHAMHSDFEPPTIENTRDLNTALSGLSALFDDELRVAHRARLEMYRRETGGMGGLPQVEFSQRW